MKLTIRDLRLAVQLKLYASAKWIKKKIKIIATLLFWNTEKYRGRENQQMYIDPHQSESQIRFSRMRKKTQQQRNEQLASENYLPNTFSLMYA